MLRVGKSLEKFLGPPSYVKHGLRLKYQLYICILIRSDV